MTPTEKSRSAPKPLENIGFISTRIAGTDGVSLEIAKWADVLSRIGGRCYYFAGELDRPEEVSCFVPRAHFDHPDILAINGEVFGRRVRSRGVTDSVHRIKEELKEELYRYIERFSIDLIVPENILAIPMNIPLGIALTELIAETGIPTIAHHHDFSWERIRFLVNACEDYLSMAFPPDLPSIEHVVINSLASEQLSHRRGISNTIVPNVLDFDSIPPGVDSYHKDLRRRVGLDDNDVLVLQPTRVVPRKWIERSIEIVNNLELAKPFLIISHASGDEGDDYNRRIQEYARNMRVEIIHIDDMIAPERGTDARGEKLYTIGDVYRCADLVTYPSGYEGFGNAFLEAVYYERPIVVNRYSTYVRDIEPKGFDVILMDGFVSVQNIVKIREVLSDRERRLEMVRKNFALAEKHFSYRVLEEKLSRLLEVFSNGPPE
ncbi:MAG: glycosyltransferase family 4 protein [bacterium]|nr:MAG: glycosyltransferase family 4 protein [bacterium]